MKALSLFSGAGGDTLGMSLAGVEVVAYSELKPRFCNTHDANFGGCRLLGNDITKISDEDFATLKGQVDIIFAGFPCQPFSHGGKKKGREDPRGQMYVQFARAARIIQPKWIIGENVAGLARRVEDMTEILSEFKRAGYSCDHRTYKTDCFGVPQKRERLIILGKRGDVAPVLPDPPVDAPKLGLQNILKFDMEGALRVSPETFEGVPPECILTNLKNAEDERNPHPYIVRQRERDLGFSFGKRDSPYHCEIVDLRKPSKTIICTYDHQPRLLVPLRNALGCFLRAMLPDELKMVQGFPSDYVLTGNTKEQVIQVGNAVPPQLVRWVVEGL